MRYALLLFAGCAHYYKLDVASVQTLEVRVVNGDGSPVDALCAHNALVSVIAVDKDGTRHAEGSRDHVRKSQFDPRLVAITATTGSFHDRSWNPPSDPLAMLQVKQITIEAKLVDNPQVTARIAIPPTWACDPPTLYVGGNDGSNGMLGDTALADGATGGTGNKGGRGGDAPETLARIGWVTGPVGQKLALARVGTHAFVLDPSTPLHLDATGGTGGAGGTGGNGGSVTAGKAGQGGKAGDGGDGGAGGEVVVQWDAADPALAKLITVDVSGGKGGPAGVPGSGGVSTDVNLGGDPGAAGADGAAGPAGSSRTEAVVGLQDRLLDDVPSAPVSADQMRIYAGTATYDDHKETLAIRSTRMRAFHFTIEGTGCTLKFRRPVDRKELHYELVDPTACMLKSGLLQVSKATLDLDPKNKTLTVAWEGSGRHFSFIGKRR